MQLKITRSQREGGVISKTAIFCIDARVQYTAEEQRHIRRYKLGREVVYDSQARSAMMERAAAARDPSGKPINYGGDPTEMLTGAARSAASGVFSAAKSLGMAALATTMLRVTVESLERGHHIECKSLEELIEAEEAILAACRNLTLYLERAATFDGREILYSFDTEGAEPVAVAVAAKPALIVEPGDAPATSDYVIETPAAEPAAEPLVAEHEPAVADDEGYSVDAEGEDHDPYDEEAASHYNPYGRADHETRLVLAFVAVMVGAFVILGPVPGPLVFRVAAYGVALFIGYKVYQRQG